MPATIHRPLDVLVVEAEPDIGIPASRALVEAGHRVHRCHEPGQPAFPCTAVTKPGSCPLEGPIDVTLLVREHSYPHPTAAEGAVVCALRAGVPVVEDGPELLDPFTQFISVRAEGDPVAACEGAAEHRWDDLASLVVGRGREVMVAHSVGDVALSCRITGDGDTLRVHLSTATPVGPRVEQALAVRAFDVVRSERGQHAKVAVHCGVDSLLD